MFDPLIAARAVHIVSTTLVVGALLFRLFVAEPALRSLRDGPIAASLGKALTWLLWIGVMAMLASGAAWLLLLAANIAHRPMTEILSDTTWQTLLTETQFGRDWQMRGIVGALLVLFLLFEPIVRGPRAGPWYAMEALFGAGLAGSLAFAGHGAAEGDNVHIVADVLHLLAASAWIGGLIPLAVLLGAAYRQDDGQSAAATLDATSRFSIIGLISVGTLIASGVINTWFLVGTLPALFGTDYGRLLVAKIALFSAMVGTAAVNRMKLTPRLARGFTMKQRKDAIRHLMRNSIAETILGIAVLAIVGVLGAMTPALHIQIAWPWSRRLVEDAWTDPQFILDALVAAIAFGVALLLPGARRWLWRWALAATGVLMLVFAAQRLKALTVPAFPTTYYVSPNGFSAVAIARGRTLYEAHCAGCHGVDGRGRAGQSVPGADLTAAHIYDHTDGDLFWWISQGIGDAMPGFASAVDEKERWDLIDFVHANADGARLRKGADAGVRLPDFSVDCPDGSSLSPERLRGQIIHLVIAGPATDDRLRELTELDLGGDVATIVLSLEGTTGRNLPFCFTNNRDVARAFSFYRPANFPTDGTEFLIDAAGRLRAVWSPGLEPVWTEAELARQVTRMREPVPVAQRAPKHVHEN